jgi:hypothetical protein
MTHNAGAFPQRLTQRLIPYQGTRVTYVTETLLHVLHKVSVILEHITLNAVTQNPLWKKNAVMFTTVSNERSSGTTEGWIFKSI